MDINYWDSFYKQHGRGKGINKSSTFAKFCLNFFLKENVENIIELGSGNGRDAIYFSHRQISVVAIDQSTVAIDLEREALSSQVSQYLHPKAMDFVTEDYSQYVRIDAFYSRFTIHSITRKEEELLLHKVYDALKVDGLFCIEVRTTRDPLFGKGIDCGDNTFIFNEHKRRFVDSDKFLKQVLNMGFRLLYFTEENNLSVYNNDNPVLMRIILKK